MSAITLTPRLIHVYNFPDPGATLRFSLKSLSECLQNGLIVLDANVLLLPLATGALALSEIERVYSGLIAQNRLHIPTHALREYLANRPTKIKELIDQLTKKKEKHFPASSSPLLQKAKIFNDLTNAEKSLQEESNKLSKIITQAISEIKQWETNDPVSALYQSLKLSENLISDPIDFTCSHEVEAFLKENDARVTHKIPPGFKDSRKDENDIGDFLIWKSILKIAQENPEKDLIFVSGEVKTDWIYRSAGQALHVREELIEEYRHASKGGSFHLTDLATLLEEFKASDAVVNEVRSSELVASIPKIEEKSNFPSPPKWSDFKENAYHGVIRWFAESEGIAVTPLGLETLRLTTDANGRCFLIQIRPLRHAEYVMSRVYELQTILLSEIAKIAAEGDSRKFEKGIIFVCENLDGAVSAKRLTEEMKIDLTIVSGYLTQDNIFMTV